jgi:hypothetical protein
MEKKPLSHRIAADLKENYLKTGIMMILAGVFVVVWMPIIFPESDLKASESNSSESFTASVSTSQGDPISHKNHTTTARKAVTLYPLAEAVPYEQLKRNPFDSSIKQKLDSEREKDASSRTKKQGETLAEEEDRVLKTVTVTCTITGDTSPYAVLEGSIFSVGEEYKGFKIKEIGEGYVILAGQMVTRRIEVEY